MGGKIHVVEQVIPVELLQPATDAAGRTSGYLLLTNVQRATIVCHITQGNAATILLSVLQATDEEGSNSKVIATNVPIWSNLDCVASDTLVRRTDGVNYTTDAGVKHKIVAFQIDPEFLDTANNFVAIALSTGASDATNITSAVALLEQRYAQPVPSAAYSDVA